MSIRIVLFWWKSGSADLSAGEDACLPHFAAYPYDDRHLIAAYDFSDPIIFRNYLEEVFSIRQIDAFIDDTMDVTEDDKLITLETGVSGEPDQRYLVQAVLVEEQ